MTENNLSVIALAGFFRRNHSDEALKRFAASPVALDNGAAEMLNLFRHDCRFIERARPFEGVDGPQGEAVLLSAVRAALRYIGVELGVIKEEQGAPREVAFA